MGLMGKIQLSTSWKTSYFPSFRSFRENVDLEVNLVNLECVSKSSKIMSSCEKEFVAPYKVILDHKESNGWTNVINLQRH